LHGGLSASWAGNVPFWGTFLPQKRKIGRIGHVVDVNISIYMRRLKLDARDAPFVKYRAASQFGRKIGMCGYTAVPEDGRTCISLLLRTAYKYT